MRGLGFTFARCQPVFAGRSEFSPERETKLGDVCQNFAIVLDSHLLQGIPATFAECFLRVASLPFHSSLIQTRVPLSPEDFLKLVSFSTCSMYVELPRFNPPLFDPAFL